MYSLNHNSNLGNKNKLEGKKSIIKMVSLINKVARTHSVVQNFFYFFILIFLSFCLFRAVPVAYEGSLARSPIGVVAASLHHSHSNARSEPDLRPTPHSSHRNARSLTHWARPRMEPTSSWMLVGFVNCWAMTGTPKIFLKREILYLPWIVLALK